MSGLIRKGKKQQTQKCLVLGNDQVPPFHVKAGEETVVRLGGPYRFEFERVKNGEVEFVSGPSVRVLGAAGETYDRFWNCVPAPQLGLRKAGAMIDAAETKVRQMAAEVEAAQAAVHASEAAAKTARQRIGQAQAAVRQARASLSSATTSRLRPVPRAPADADPPPAAIRESQPWDSSTSPVRH